MEKSLGLSPFCLCLFFYGHIASPLYLNFVCLSEEGVTKLCFV
jgi:hypothetical protein